MKKLLSLLTMFSIFIGGLAIADYAYIEDPDGKIHTVEMTMLSDGKFIIKMEDVSPFWITFLKSGMSHQVSNSYNFNYSSKSTDEVSIQFVYKSKRMGAKFRYNFKTGEFVYNYAKLGETANSNYNPDDYEDNNPEENTENNGTENNDTENNNTENNDTENNNTENNDTENNDTENNDTENNNTGNNDETQDTYDDSTQNSSNNDKTETVKKNTTLNLTTNDKSPEIKQYINLTIETDEDYTDRLLLSVKYRSSSSSSWSSIKNTSSTYFLDYSDDWDNGYYEMKSSNYGEITLKNLVKFKKSGSYRIYVKDTDGNEEYIQFTVSEPEDDNNEEEPKITNEKTENIVSENKSNYADAASYHVAITDLLDKCYLSTDDFYYELDNGTVSSVENAVNTALKTCKDVKTEIENIGSRNGDTSLRDAILSLVKETILYFEKYTEAFPIIKNERDLTDEEKNTLYLITLELENIGDKLDELTDSANKIIETFAKKWGYELGKGCSIDGSKYGYEQTLAYRRACQLGITTIQDINSARLDQPLTRAQLAKMMSVFEFSVLGNFPQTKGKANYKDVSSKLGDLENYIQIAYEYGIMGVDANGFAIQYFNPKGTLNRGDFATVFSRVLWGEKNNKNGSNYYTNHLNALKAVGILTNTDHKITEARGYVMLMMYRAANNLENLKISVNPNTMTLDELNALVALEGNQTNSSSNKGSSTSTTKNSNSNKNLNTSSTKSSNTNSKKNTTSYTDLDRYIDTARTRSKYGLDTTITVNKGTPGSSNGVVNINSTCAKFGGTNCEIKGGKYYGVTAEITSNGTIKIDTSHSKYGSTSALTSNKGTIGAPKGTIGAPKGKL